MNIGLPIVMILAVAAAFFFVRHPYGEDRARFLRRAAFILMAVFAVFLGAFVIGDTFTDPGGWEAVGLIALWAVPLAALVLIAWRRPRWATPLFAALVTAVVGVSVWFAIDPSGWRAFEDRNGPVRDIVVFVLAAALAFYGLRRTRPAGVLMLVLGTLPLTISSIGTGSGLPSLMMASSPTVVAGALYVAAANLSRHQPPTSTGAGPEQEPRAA